MKKYIIPEEVAIVRFLKEKGYSDADVLSTCRDPTLKLRENSVEVSLYNYNVMQEYQRNRQPFLQRILDW